VQLDRAVRLLASSCARRWASACKSRREMREQRFDRRPCKVQFSLGISNQPSYSRGNCVRACLELGDERPTKQSAISHHITADDESTDRIRSLYVSAAGRPPPGCAIGSVRGQHAMCPSGHRRATAPPCEFGKMQHDNDVTTRQTR
jgi:hypothetical protein